LRNLAVRPEVGQQREVDAAQAFGPGFETGYMINADAQDLGI